MERFFLGIIGLVLGLMEVFLIFIKKNKEDNYTKKEAIFVGILISISFFVCFYKITENSSEWINRIRMYLALIGMGACAYIDYKEKRIPNVFTAGMAISGIIILAIYYFMNLDGALAYIFSSIIATVLSGLCLTIASFVSKGGIGNGDIKLICALGILGGVYTVMGTVFIGISVCALVSIVLLLLKKKGTKDTLPFGPFLFVGYVVSIMISMY